MHASKIFEKALQIEKLQEEIKRMGKGILGESYADYYLSEDHKYLTLLDVGGSGHLDEYTYNSSGEIIEDE
tara:strand:- start:773 stop:985 length:213 start_codon:yes stop_codon:yes gene_type:complete